MVVSAHRLPPVLDLANRGPGDYAYFRCDTEAELPSTNVVNGDRAVTYDTKKRWVRSGGTWAEVPQENTATWGNINGTLANQTDLQEALDAAGGGGIAAGIIAIWYGLIANIPAGWALCDGGGGRPDFRDMFIKGAPAGEEAGTIEGSDTHSHDDHAALAHAGGAVAAHPSHTHTYSQVPNHVHGVSTILRTATTGGDTTQVTNAQDTSSTKDATRKTDNPDGGVAQGTTDGPSASLTHSVTQPNDHAAQSHSEESNEPVHHWVLFIIKT